MIKSFKNIGIRDIFNGKSTKDARKVCPRSLWKVATRKLDQLDSVKYIEDLRIPPGNKLESLSGKEREKENTAYESMTNTEFVLVGPMAIQNK